ncbi:ribonuclease N [Acidovorax sp. Be4]|jgi:ribonuclease T1|uniref:Ribonuclease N n=1 Tax=Acidovorax bellezanensis TaxID=2976702 RepID=A0ABT2PQH5_9BURK|nr:ribonuclease domain-containing protein [Acidovorax sp. Be4]MCT9811532.1 ribonuclease N [Acidovorax sp. Be4]
MLKAVVARFLQTGFAIVLGTACAVTPLAASARGAQTSPELSSIALSELPPQGRRTYGLIRQGGPFPYAKDGSVFGNRERILPSRKRGYYREYTVETPRSRDRGAQRIVCGGLEPQIPQACYYTRDHYASFHYIIE